MQLLREVDDDLRAQLLEQERRARAAEAANHAKDEFLATVSHELRAPLNAVLGWVQLLRRGTLDEAQAAHALETIERNALIQRSLIEEILDVSRIIAGKVSLEKTSVSLRRVAEAAVEAARPAASAKRIAIAGSLNAPHNEVMGDPRRLQQAIGNLLSNAIKFTPAGGTVRVEVLGTDGAASVRVTDTGIGIRKDFLPHVFDRFRQAEGAVTRAYGGLGLGLAIVRHIAELHGGWVLAESGGPGKGASLTFTLPVDAHSSGGSTRASMPAPAEVDLAGLHVLFVDDEPDARDLADEFLRGRGARVSLAASAEAALAILRSVVPDVLVSDIGMPEESGLTLIQRIRTLPVADGGGIPAIAVTGHASREDARRALEAGFQEHLSKPLELAKLAEALSRLGHPSTRFRAGAKLRPC